MKTKQKTKSRPRVEIEEFQNSVLLICKIFNSAKLRVSARISKAQLQRLLAGGWHVTRKPSSQRGTKERAQRGSYGRPLSDEKIAAAVLPEDYEVETKE